jgi:hypothetical protein
MSFIATLARLPMAHSLGISIFSTIYILGVLILSSHSGQADIKPAKFEKWLKTAQSNTAAKNPTPSTHGTKNSALIQPHSITGYQIPLGGYFGTTVACSVLFHTRYPSTVMPAATVLNLSPQHHPHLYFSQAPPLVRLLIGVGGVLILDSLKSMIFKREKRLLWPEWLQSAFTFFFNFAAAVWVVLGARLVWIWGWPRAAF